MLSPNCHLAVVAVAVVVVVVAVVVVVVVVVVVAVVVVVVVVVSWPWSWSWSWPWPWPRSWSWSWSWSWSPSLLSTTRTARGQWPVAPGRQRHAHVQARANPESRQRLILPLSNAQTHQSLRRFVYVCVRACVREGGTIDDRSAARVDALHSPLH